MAGMLSIGEEAMSVLGAEHGAVRHMEQRGAPREDQQRRARQQHAPGRRLRVSRGSTRQPAARHSVVDGALGDRQCRERAAAPVAAMIQNRTEEPRKGAEARIATFTPALLR